MANQYVFFDVSARDRFVRFLDDHNIPRSMRDDEISGFVVETPDALVDDLQQAIEKQYDALFDAQRELVDSTDDSKGHDRMGVSITLSDGRPCLVRIPAEYGRRLLAQFTTHEIHELVTAIARSVEHPSAGPLCRDP